MILLTLFVCLTVDEVSWAHFVVCKIDKYVNVGGYDNTKLTTEDTIDVPMLYRLFVLYGGDIDMNICQNGGVKREEGEEAEQHRLPG